MVEIIFTIIGFFGLPLYMLLVQINTDAIETVSSEPRKPMTKTVWFLLAVLGGAIGWSVGKGLDRFWEVLVS